MKPNTNNFEGQRHIVALLAALLLLLSACGGGGEAITSTPGSGTTDESQAAGADTESTSDGGEADTATEDDDSDGSEAGPTPAAEPVCIASDDSVFYDMLFVNDSPELRYYSFDVNFTRDDGSSHEASGFVVYVSPGEAVRQRFFTSKPADSNLTGCEISRFEHEPEIGSTLGLGDINGCQNLEQGEFGGIGYDVVYVNGSNEIAANYTSYFVIRNADGERLDTVISLGKGADGSFEPVQPGETYTDNSGSIVEFDPSHTCEIIYADRYTEEQFFVTESGVATGSLDSDIGFETGSAELTEDAKTLLSLPLQEIIDRHTGTICIEGFADSVGDDAANLALSEARAEAVAKYMASRGVSNEIETVGYGEQFATADNVDDPTQRRVDISLAACR